MENKIIHSTDKYPILTLLSYGWITFMALSDYIGFDHPWYTTAALIIEFTFIYFSLTSVDIVISENDLTKGTKYSFILGLKNPKSISRNEYTGLRLKQNDKKYFEIFLEKNNQPEILLTSLPNQNPAKDKLTEIEEKIVNTWTELADKK